jgi:hypothetical protein
MAEGKKSEGAKDKSTSSGKTKSSGGGNTAGKKKSAVAGGVTATKKESKAATASKGEGAETISRASAPEAGNVEKNKSAGSGPLKTFMIIGAAILIAVLLIYLNFSQISKAAIEKLASNSLGVPVTIGNMEIDAREKKITVTDLKIANPEGFETPYLMESQTVLVDGESFSRDKVVFEEMLFKGTVIHFIMDEKETNLSALGKNLKKPDREKTEAEKSPVKIVIRELTIGNARLVPSPNLVKLGVREVELPVISGSVGDPETGISPQRAITEVTKIIVNVAAERATRSDFVDRLKADPAGTITEKLGIKKDTIDSIKHGLGNLFE